MTHWGGLACFFGAIALYLLSQKTGSDIEFLKSATKVRELKDLESNALPLIIAISGIVGSETNLLKCEHSVEHKYLKRNWMFSWVQDSALMQPIGKEVPWYLDDGTGRVHVTGAYGATGLVLRVGSGVFEKTEPSSAARGIFYSLRGLEMLGVRRIERVLQIGTQLTIVGAVVKDGFGNVWIQKPDQWVFYVSHIPLDQFIYESGTWSRWLKYACIGLTILGMILISMDVMEKTTHNSERRQQQQISRRIVSRGRIHEIYHY